MKTPVSTFQRVQRTFAFVALLALMVPPVLTAQMPDRSKPPQPGPPPTLRLAPIHHFMLSNGLSVVLMEKHNVPVLQMNMVIRGGTANDSDGKSGLASVATAMLMDGAGSRDALQLADAIDYLGARINASARLHISSVVLSTSVERLDSALALYADVILRPTYPAVELERERKQRLTNLLQWRDEPRALASVIFDRTLFGTRHPYGIQSMGDEKSLRSFSGDDLHKFYEQYFHPGNATLIVVGDVTVNSLEPKLEAAFGRWEGGAVASAVIEPVAQVKKRGIFLVDKPGAAQTVIRIGRIGAARLSEDFYPLVVMNTILGGSFTSRLNQNLREKHGYTYGASSSFDFRPIPGPFVASASVQTAVSDKALKEFMNELEGILRPIPEAEIERAKNYVALGFPGNFQSVSQIASALEILVQYNLPDDYFNNYIEHILAVTGKDVERVAKKYIDPSAVDIILVGDRKEIEAGVKALNLGTIKNLTIEDVLGKAPDLSQSK
jgi:predicted Zn-dependent peptidase